MTRQALWQIDAFTDKVFGGNPAAVCPLEEWLPDETLRRIAMENNLSETAFFVPKGENFHLRWFTPASEIDLCGHATLASAFAIFELMNYKQDKISFETRSGILNVVRSKRGLTMDFPLWPYEEQSGADHERIEKIIGQKTQTVLKSKGAWCAVLADAAEVQNFKPDIPAINTLENVVGLVVTAAGTNGVDFVSRFFAPQYGIDEDPVTGATHCMLAPYWGAKLAKTELKAKQLSARGGDLTCVLTPDGRVEISGQAVLYLEGSIHV